MRKTRIQILPGLRDYVENLEPGDIPAQRKAILEPLAKYLGGKRVAGETEVLNFICTHNSRRSQLSQIWATVWAKYYGMSVHCVSGGLEATAFNIRAVQALERAGFRIESSRVENPRYAVFYSDEVPPIIAFSKLYYEAVEKGARYAAIMTCAHADEQCPVIPGAEVRFALDYDDPGLFDGTAEEVSRYDERCRQIAVEMKYVFTQADAEV